MAVPSAASPAWSQRATWSRGFVNVRGVSLSVLEEAVASGAQQVVALAAVAC